jgi:hypothetical protein
MLRILQMSDSLLCAHSCFDLELSDSIFSISALQNTNGCIGNSRLAHNKQICYDRVLHNNVHFRA